LAEKAFIGITNGYFEDVKERLSSTLIKANYFKTGDATYKKYHWVKGPKLKLSQGIHYIRVINREDGAKMDQWLLWLLDSPSKDNWKPVRAER